MRYLPAPGNDGGQCGANLAAVLDDEAYPALTSTVRNGAFGDADSRFDDMNIVFGLGLVLEGVEALMAAKDEG